MSWLWRFYRTSIGLKVGMGLTGLAMFGFIVGHLAGNLLIFGGPEMLNDYARFLHESPRLVWAARLGLVAALLIHLHAALTLTGRNHAARDVSYQRWRPKAATIASRTMFHTGGLILAFVVIHLLHFTFGKLHPHFDPRDVYANVVSGFQQWWYAAGYIAAMLMLGLHLFHGTYTMLRSLGLGQPRIARTWRALTKVLVAAIVLGYISIPAAVLAGALKLAPGAAPAASVSH